MYSCTESTGHPYNIQPVCMVSTNSTAFGQRVVNNMPIDISSPIGWEISKASISNSTYWTLIGSNHDVDADREVVWEAGGTYPLPSTGRQLTLVLGSTKDTSTGVGAQKVLLTYLTSAYVQYTTEIETNGTSVVTSAENIFRVNSMYINRAGAIHASDAVMSLKNATSTDTYAYIGSSGTVNKSAVYSVPAGKTLYIAQNTYSAGNVGILKKCFVIFSIHSNMDSERSTDGEIFYPLSEIGVTDSVWTGQYALPIRVCEKTDFHVCAQGSAGNTDAVCSCQLRGWLEDN